MLLSFLGFVIGHRQRADFVLTARSCCGHMPRIAGSSGVLTLTLTGECQPAAIFIWRLAICAQGLSGQWRVAHSKLPWVYARHVKNVFSKFNCFFFRRQLVLFEYYHCNSIYSACLRSRCVCVCVGFFFFFFF